MEQGKDPEAVTPGAAWPGTTGPMRVGTVEREKTVDALTAHAAAGRLDPEEFDTRITAALTARTVDDLHPLLADLPSLTPDAAARPARNPARRRVPLIPGAVQPWLASSLITTGIWAATGGGYFWPEWVIGPWGVITLVPLLGRHRHGDGTGDRQGRHSSLSATHQRSLAATSDGGPSDRVD